MTAAIRENAARLSNGELLGEVARLAGQEREVTVELVAHLAELDLRKLHLAEGFGSLFSYCRSALRLSEHAALNRIEAARLSRRFPVILELLEKGELHLSTLRLLAPHLRPDNCESVLAEARGRSKRDVEKLVARLAPKPDAAAFVRRLPARPDAARLRSVPTAPNAGEGSAASPWPAVQAAESSPSRPLTASAGCPGEPPLAGEGSVASSAGVQVGIPARSLVASEAVDAEVPSPVLDGEAALDRLLACSSRKSPVKALAPERYRVQFTIGETTHGKLRQAQELLRREVPDGDLAAIFERALTLLLEDVARRKLAAVSKPRQGRTVAPVGSRLIPARVKRAVWVRDGGRCAFVAVNGRRCGERAFLEFHHRIPHALGGEATVDNISLRCRGHNVLEAMHDFGPAKLPSRGSHVSASGRARHRTAARGAVANAPCDPGEATWAPPMPLEGVVGQRLAPGRVERTQDGPSSRG